MNLVRLIVLALAVPGRQDTAAEFSRWEEDWEKASAAAPGEGSLRRLLEEAAKDRSAMKGLADSCRGRAEKIASARFRSGILKREWETALQEADRLKALKEAKYAELEGEAKAWYGKAEAVLVEESAKFRERQAAMEKEKKVLSPQFERSLVWEKQVNAWLARVNAMPRSTEAEYAAYRAAFAEYKKEEARYNDEVTRLAPLHKDFEKRWNTLADDGLRLDDKIGRLKGDWAARLLGIEVFMKEFGRPLLDAVVISSKKEDAWRKADGELRKLEEEQKRDLAKLGAMLAASRGIMAEIAEGAAASQVTPALLAATATPWATRPDDLSARAWGPSIPSPGGPRTAVPVPRVLILSSSRPGAEPPAGAGAESGFGQRAAAVAAALAEHYVELPRAAERRLEAATPPSRPSGLSLGEADAEFSQAFDDGSAAIVLSDADLRRAVHPGVFISDEEYRRAQARAAEARILATKLEAAIVRLREGRDDLVEEARYFQDLRAEMGLKTLRELLSLNAAALKHLRKSGSASRLSPEQLERLERVQETLKLGLAPVHAEAAVAEEAWKIRDKAFDEGAALLVELGSELSGSADVQAILQGAGNLMKTGREIQRYRSDPKTATLPRWKQLGEVTKLGLDALGQVVPVVAVGVAAGGIVEEGVRWNLTREGVDALGASLKTRDEAIVHLARLRLRTSQDLEQAEATVRSYEAVAPARRRQLQIPLPR